MSQFCLQQKPSHIIIASRFNHWQYFVFTDSEPVFETTLVVDHVQIIPLNQLCDYVEKLQCKSNGDNLFMFSSDRTNRSITVVVGRYIQRLSLDCPFSIVREKPLRNNQTVNFFHLCPI